MKLTKSSLMMKSELTMTNSSLFPEGMRMNAFSMKTVSMLKSSGRKRRKACRRTSR